MKKYIAFVSALIFAASLTACAPAKTEADPENTSPEPAADEQSGFALSSAVYPDMPQYPDEEDYTDGETGEFDGEAYSAAYYKWRDANNELRPEDVSFDGLDPYIKTSVKQFLSGSDGRNTVYSPLNVYMALAMLAETTDGNSRAQILELLGPDSIEALREQATALWKANYSDDGLFTSVLASSIWMKDGIRFNKQTMKTLADTYYASAYQGVTGTEEYDKALQDWLNEQTGGLLKEQASGVRMDASTVLTLATAIYFRAKWSEEFKAEDTAPGQFHKADGSTAECDFMHNAHCFDYYRGEGFSSVALPFHSSANMMLILPDEGTSVDGLLAGDEVTDFMLNCREWDNVSYPIVELAVPKFDVASDMSLIDGLKTMGVTDVFDEHLSDFSPMSDDVDTIYVSEASHAARVAIDEQGCVAAAYTIMMEAAAAEPDDIVSFVLDRPFIFAIINNDGLPLFAGVVNDPS